MNKTELVEVVSKNAAISKAEAQKVVTATLDAIVAGVVSDGKVILPGFGTFETRQRSARNGRIPVPVRSSRSRLQRLPLSSPARE